MPTERLIEFSGWFMLEYRSRISAYRDYTVICLDCDRTTDEPRATPEEAIQAAIKWGWVDRRCPHCHEDYLRRQAE